MNIDALIRSKNEIREAEVLVRKVKEEAEQLRHELREDLRSNYPVSEIIGLDFLYFKTKWMRSAAIVGVFDKDRFTDNNGNLQFMYHDLIKGADVQVILSECEIELDEYEIKSENYYLMAVLYETGLNHVGESAIEGGLREYIEEYLFVDVGF